MQFSAVCVDIAGRSSARGRQTNKGGVGKTSYFQSKNRQYLENGRRCGQSYG